MLKDVTYVTLLVGFSALMFNSSNLSRLVYEATDGNATAGYATSLGTLLAWALGSVWCSWKLLDTGAIVEPIPHSSETVENRLSYVDSGSRVA